MGRQYQLPGAGRTPSNGRVAGVTELSCAAGRLYLADICDLPDRRPLGRSLGRGLSTDRSSPRP